MSRFFGAVLTISLALSMGALFSGCATTTTQSAQNGQASSGRVVCKKETVVGSHLPRTVCRDVQAAEQDRDLDQRALERIQHDSTVVRPEQMNP